MRHHPAGSASSHDATTGDFYVATNGNDAWPGTLAQPFATMDRARRAVQSLKATVTTRPIVVLVRNGTYFLPATLAFTSADSGTSSARIIYANYPGETPVISGGRRLTGWTQNSDGSWEAAVPSGVYFTQLWVNDARRPRPRTTPSSYLYIYKQYSANNSTQVSGLYYRTGPAGSVPSAMANLKDVELVNFEFWDNPRFRIASVDTNAKLIRVNTTVTQDVFHGFLPGHRFLLENVKEALHQPGQWYLDRSTSRIVYLPKSGESLSTATIIAPRLQKIMTANHLSHVTFQGLTFAHSDWQIGPYGYMSGQAGQGTPAAMTLSFSSDVIFEGSTVEHTGGYGIEFLGTGPASAPYLVQFRDGLVTDVGSGGIRVGGPAVCAGSGIHNDTNVPQYIYLGNNLVTGGGRITPEGMGILVGDAHHALVEHNEISDFYATGVGVGYNWDYGCNFAHDDVVQFNHIHNLGEGITSDLGAVYFLTGTNKNNQMLNNKVHDIDHDPVGYGGWGLYVDEGATGVLVKNNLVYRTTATSLHMNQSKAAHPNPTPPPNIFTNNILVFGRGGGLDRHNDSNFLSLIYERNVDYYDKAQMQYGYWYCEGKPTCTGYFTFNYNLYYDKAVSGGKPAKPFVATPYTAPNTGPQPPIIWLTSDQWIGRGEDAQSMWGDPLFVNLAPGVDDFRLTANSPAYSLGFVNFDTSQAGRLPSAWLHAPANDASFPLQIPSITSF